MVIMLRECCCGCTLKTGTIIVGFLDMIYGLMNLIGAIVAAIAIAAADHHSDEETKKVLVGLCIAMAVIAGTRLLVAICLIAGAVDGKPALLVPWMVFTIVCMVGSTIIFILKFSLVSTKEDATNGATNLIGGIIYMLLEIYYLLVVYSLYRELKGTAPPNPIELEVTAPLNPVELKGTTSPNSVELKGTAPSNPVELKGTAPPNPV